MKWVPTTAADVAARWKEFRSVDVWDLFVQGLLAQFEQQSEIGRCTSSQNFLQVGLGFKIPSSQETGAHRRRSSQLF